jgi:hypothetical protein
MKRILIQNTMIGTHTTLPAVNQLGFAPEKLSSTHINTASG